MLCMSYECVVCVGPLYVIVEYAANGNLRDFLRKHRPDSNSFYEQPIGQASECRGLTYGDLYNYAFQVCPHNQLIIHWMNPFFV